MGEVGRLNNHSSGNTRMPWGFHESTSRRVVWQYALTAMGTISTPWKAPSVRVGFSPNDYFWVAIPNKKRTPEAFERILSIFGMKPCSEWIERTLIYLKHAIEWARSYMQEKWYKIPGVIGRFRTDRWLWVNNVFDFIDNIGKLHGESAQEGASIFLKVVRAFYNNLTATDSKWETFLDPLSGEFKKDKQLIKGILEFFNNDQSFTYKGSNTQRFSRESRLANGSINTNYGVAIPRFQAEFDTKRLRAMVRKTISDNKYWDAEAIKDKNRMRIFVRKEDVLHMALVVWQLFTHVGAREFHWEQKWNIIAEWNDIWSDFQRAYIQSGVVKDDTLFTILSNLPKNKDNKKEWRTLKRTELKFISAEPSLEVQIVPYWNDNEIWWNSHVFYEMKADIQEEIMLRQGYSEKSRVMEHIRRFSIQRKAEWLAQSDEEIFEHIVQESCILPIREGHIISGKEGKKVKDKKFKALTEYEFFTNKDFLHRGIKTRKKKLKYEVYSNEEGKFVPIDSFSWQNSDSQ